MANLVRVGMTGKAPTEPINFSYTGGMQSYVVPKKGTYQLEVWGAQGGGTGYPSYAGGGQGGYAKGNVFLERNQVLYICVGGHGASCPTTSGSYNGGGPGDGGSDIPDSGNGATASGGGATHIGKTNSILQNTSQANLYIVAGGGGGGFGFNASGTIRADSGGAGSGGTYGGNSVHYSGTAGRGGYPNNGLYGHGANPGGGGGLWGGGPAGNTAFAGGGGSGYVGGCIAGTTTTTEGGRSGNGYARITYIGR